MLIYKAERDAGLDKQILATASISYASEITLCNKFEIEDTINAYLKDVYKTAAGQSDHDLHYLKSLLVTTNLNKNDDYFDRAEVWAARHTPSHKPLNDGHDCSKIIGHMVGSYPINEEGKTIAEDTVVDNLPQKFHLIDTSVLYKYWDKKDLQERMDKILAQIAKGEKFVSMEALFKGFDYFVVDGDTSKVIARNEETAFLTKHLRIYGGTGIYQDKKVGRLLRNITFSGKGLVDKPANPESIIFANASSVLEVPKNLVYKLIEENSKSAKVLNMPSELEVKLQAEVETLKASLKEHEKQNWKAELDKVLAERDSYKKAHEDHSKKMSEMEGHLKDAHAKHDELKKNLETMKAGHNADLEETKKKYEEASKEVEKMKAEQRKFARVAVAKTAFKVDEANKESVENAVSFVDNTFELSDEKFEVAIKAMEKNMMTMSVPTNKPQDGNTTFPNQATVTAQPTIPGAKQPPKATDKPTGKTLGSTETDPAAKVADTKILDGVVAEKTPALAAETPNAGDEIRKAVASMFGCGKEETK